MNYSPEEARRFQTLPTPTTMYYLSIRILLTFRCDETALLAKKAGMKRGGNGLPSGLSQFDRGLIPPVWVKIGG